jgi:hypothetical protein
MLLNFKSQLAAGRVLEAGPVVEDTIQRRMIGERLKVTTTCKTQMQLAKKSACFASASRHRLFLTEIYLGSLQSLWAGIGISP